MAAAERGTVGRRIVAVALCLAGHAAALSGAAAERVFVRHPATLEQCLSLAPDAYRTGLIFNPDGYATYYEQAFCFQNLAVVTRDAAYCERVRERRSLFFDGSGVAPDTCRDFVARQRAEDRRTAERIAAAPVHRVVDAAVRRNGNGRDYDLHVRTEGSYAGRYRLTVTAAAPGGAAAALLDRAQPLGDAAAELIHLLPAETWQRALGPRYGAVPLTLTLTLTLGSRGADDDHVLALVPTRQRRSRRTLAVTLDALPAWVPERLD